MLSEKPLTLGVKQIVAHSRNNGKKVFSAIFTSFKFFYRSNKDFMQKTCH
jgi:hypothetical protein